MGERRIVIDRVSVGFVDPNNPTVAEWHYEHLPNERVEWSDWREVSSRKADHTVTAATDFAPYRLGGVVTRSITWQPTVITEERKLLRVWTEPNGQRMGEVLDIEQRTRNV